MANRLKLPTGGHLWEFEQGTVQFQDAPDAKGTPRPQFSVMILDAYGTQWEWSIGLTHSTFGLLLKQPPSLDRLYMVSHIFSTNGRRHVAEVSESVGIRLMERFHYLIVNYPSLLFNKSGEGENRPHRPRHEGFYRFANQLACGAEPSCKLLD